MITCKDAVAQLWEYLDRSLAGLEERQVEEHLGVCRHCCGELEFAKQIRGLLRRPGQAAALTRDVRARLESFVTSLGEKA